VLRLVVPVSARMINRYRRAARQLSELGLDDLAPSTRRSQSLTAGLGRGGHNRIQTAEYRIRWSPEVAL